LGGLIHRMPATSVLTRVGVAAISALPPLNGFASEWLIFQSILRSPDLPQSGLQLIAPAAGAMLALAAALSAAAFVRLYGVGFLGQSRSEAASAAREVDRFMLTGMGIMAALCALAGIFPALVLDTLAPAVSEITGTRLPVQLSQPWLTLVPIAEARSTYNGLLVLLFIATAASAAAWAVHRLGSRAVRRGPAWDCGFGVSSPLFQYSAGGFAQPLRRVLGGVLLGAREAVEMPLPGDGRPARHSLVVPDRIWDGLYVMTTRAILAVATQANRLQFLTIRRYLSLVMGSLVALLAALTLWG
jgi:hydrogenase-4 component B